MITIAKGKYQKWLEQDGLTLLEAWARDGLTDVQIASKLGIAAKTLYRWQNSYSQICQALKRGKEPVDVEVENSLLKRANGFTYTEQTYERIWNDKLGRFIKVNTKSVTKMVVPDTTAQIFWLKNRKPDVWRDKHENSIDMMVGNMGDFVVEIGPPDESADD